jgi:hypothetical protein
MPMCDMCSRGVEFTDGFALTTTQVAASVRYWNYMLETNNFDDGLLLMYAQQQAMQSTGWLLCDACSRHFEFDQNTARECARRQVNPPGSGPADVARVAWAAATAWKQKHGRLPSWVK